MSSATSSRVSCPDLLKPKKGESPGSLLEGWACVEWDEFQKIPIETIDEIIERVDLRNSCIFQIFMANN